ncbi:uncharacterized protein TRAVEDRAFT_50892 [Trametes versicolor FP-101664 SS1]|uniref:uncharacterized protein n=1 Tax=Trametes versicolor (strain FP-101664) TaxID=717944 RepID=UPI000462336F|nr:uncharacterized protein TRAVEDRAFT_50892 [Trametes versicolor FP-101664 SS1]EIW54754.1 hypothetical protein TRAVEDRAFT_50892 [Trametes versicolor FP-101664 SS1]
MSAILGVSQTHPNYCPAAAWDDSSLMHTSIVICACPSPRTYRCVFLTIASPSSSAFAMTGMHTRSRSTALPNAKRHKGDEVERNNDAEDFLDYAAQGRTMEANLTGHGATLMTPPATPVEHRGRGTQSFASGSSTSSPLSDLHASESDSDESVGSLPDLEPAGSPYSLLATSSSAYPSGLNVAPTGVARNLLEAFMTDATVATPTVGIFADAGDVPPVLHTGLGEAFVLPQVNSSVTNSAVPETAASTSFTPTLSTAAVDAAPVPVTATEAGATGAGPNIGEALAQSIATVPTATANAAPTPGLTDAGAPTVAFLGAPPVPTATANVAPLAGLAVIDNPTAALVAPTVASLVAGGTLPLHGSPTNAVPGTTAATTVVAQLPITTVPDGPPPALANVDNTVPAAVVVPTTALLATQPVPVPGPLPPLAFLPNAAPGANAPTTAGAPQAPAPIVIAGPPPALTNANNTAPAVGGPTGTVPLLGGPEAITAPAHVPAAVGVAPAAVAPLVGTAAVPLAVAAVVANAGGQGINGAQPQAGPAAPVPVLPNMADVHAMFAGLELVPDDILLRLYAIVQVAIPTHNVFAVNCVPSNADWGTGRNDRLLCLNTVPLSIWLAGRAGSLWFFSLAGEPHARVNIGVLMAALRDYEAVKQLYQRARPRSAPASETIYASRLQTVRGRGEQIAHAVAFEEVFDATETLTVKSAMPRISAADIAEGDIVLVEAMLTRWKKPADKKKKGWPAWDVGFELQAVSLIYKAPAVVDAGAAVPVPDVPMFNL